MIGLLALLGYIATIPAANWLIANVGTYCIVNGPCVVPVGFGLYCPSGSLLIGLALVLRDVIQRTIGAWASLVAIFVGTAVAAAIAPAALVAASAFSFLLSELADFAVYTPLQRRTFIGAVLASSFIGLVVDSALFLWLAFGSLDLLGGIVLGKTWMVLLAIPLAMSVRRATA